jgi:DNA invertase Pin-like site-specific DNA recombinase
MKRIVIYIRVSSEEQTKNLSLPTQGRLCCEFCEKNGWEVVAIFVEWGESARTTDRESFQAMLRFCAQRKNGIAHVVVYRIDRFARCAEDHAIVAATLRKYGTELRSVTEPIDSSPVGRFMETVLSGMAELDNRMRSDRTKDGLKTALKVGRWGFPAPCGYLNARDANDKPIIIVDEKRAPLIQRAFQQYATGLYTRNQVLAEVTKLGLRTLKGNKMTSQNFAKTLVNEFYIGWLNIPKWGKRRRGNFPAIVDEDTFNKVQAVLAGRRPTATSYWPNRPEFPLRRFAKCGKCGAPMTATWCTGRTKNRYPYYICSKHCKGISIRAEELERQFVAILDQMRMKSEAVTLFQEIVRDVWNEKQSNVREMAAACQRRLSELEGCRQRLMEAFIYKQAITQEVFQKESDRLETEIVSARVEAAATVDDLDVAAVLQFAGQMMLNAAEYWRKLPLDQKQRFQQVLLPDGITVLENKTVKTNATSPVFNLLQLESPEKVTAGYLIFQSWKQTIDWLLQIDQLRPYFRPLLDAA